jgi:hypothetical protein
LKTRVNTLLLLALGAGVFVAAPAAAQIEVSPWGPRAWCLSGGSMSPACEYDSYQQCMESGRGMVRNRSCMRNPYPPGRPRGAPTHIRRYWNDWG